jgi:two-component system, LuxR family, sensor kinase FixL
MSSGKTRTAVSASDSDGLFETLLETAVDGIMVIDEDASVLVYNNACERLFGYPPAEVIGRNVNALMPEPFHSEHDGYLARYKKTGEKHIIGIGREVRGQRKDGSTFPMYLSVGEGKLGGKRIFVGIVNDISERTARESHIQELQRELLHATRLTSTGQLAAALAHELNQPLTAILNYTNALSEMIDWNNIEQGTVVREVLSKVSGQSERAGEIIRRLRGFVEKREPNRAIDDLNKVVQDAIGLGLVGAASNNIKVSVQLGRNLPPVPLDKVQVQQVLINLLRNAAEAMGETSRREIAIKTTREDEFVSVSIADTGPGLPDAVRKRLFEPFVTTKETGLGIGLSICRTIIEAHGGRLWAETNSAGGATFRFRLPVTIVGEHR